MNDQAELEQLLEQADEVLRESPARIPEKFWNRRPRIEGHNPNDWRLFSTSNGTVTIRTLTSVPPDSFVYVPAIRPVRIAQYIPNQSIVVVEHRIRLDPPRSIYAAYFPIGFSREILNIQPCRGPNPDCLAAGEFIGFTPGGAATPFYVRFSDRPQIGRNEFRPEFRTQPVPAPHRRRRRRVPPVSPPTSTTIPPVAPVSVPSEGREFLPLDRDWRRDPNYIDNIRGITYDVLGNRLRVHHADGTTITLNYSRILEQVGPVSGSGSIGFTRFFRDRRTGKIFPTSFGDVTTPKIACAVREAERRMRSGFHNLQQIMVNIAPP